MRVPPRLEQIWKLAEALERSFPKDGRSGEDFDLLRTCVSETAALASRHRRALSAPQPLPQITRQTAMDFSAPSPPDEVALDVRSARPYKTVNPHKHFHPFARDEFDKARAGGVVKASASGLGIGDVLFAVPALKALGGGEFYITCFDTCFSWPPSHPFADEGYRARTYHNLAKFLASQDYITKCKAVRYDRNAYYDVDFDNVRHLWHRVVGEDISLLELYQSYVGGQLDLRDAWLTPPDEVYPEFQDAVVVNVNDRRVCDLDLSVLSGCDNLVFLGIPREWQFFMSEWGLDARHYEAKDFFDMASLMNSCRLFIGCSSSPIVVADGLNVERVYLQWRARPHHQSVGGNTVTVDTDEQLVDVLLDKGII